MFYINLFEKNSIITARDSFNNCILVCKIGHEMYTSFKERKVPQAASGYFFQKWLFCKTYVRNNFCSLLCSQNSWKIFSKFIFSKVETWRPPSLLKMDPFKGLFQGKFTFTWKIYQTVIFITFTLRLIFRIDVFPNFYYWLLAKLACMTIGPFS